MSKLRIWALACLLIVVGGATALGIRSHRAKETAEVAWLVRMLNEGKLAHSDLGADRRPASTPYSGDLNVFESPGRENRLQIDRVMTLLQIAPGKSVADIGAGSGWFTVRAARRVGPKGTVFAEDINPKATEYIDQRAKKEKLTNVKAVLGVPDDAKLPVSSVDAVLLLKVYHEIAQPVAFMQRMRLPLRPGARVGIIDRNGNGSGTDHGIPQATVERELAEAGYREVAKYDFTKADGEDYFLIFERTDR